MKLYMYGLLVMTILIVQQLDSQESLQLEGGLIISESQGGNPEAGTIQWNDSKSDFEGYNGSEWVSFTNKSNGLLPSGAIPVTGYDSAVSPGNVDNLSFRYMDGSGFFTTVPSGKFVLISSINIQSNNLAETGLYKVTLRPENGGSPDFNRSYFLSGDRVSIQHITDPYGLLTVLRPGETLQAVNEAQSDFTVRVSVRGFLVDDL